MPKLPPTKNNGPSIRVRTKATIADLRALTAIMQDETGIRLCMADAAALAIAEALRARKPVSAGGTPRTPHIES